MRSSTEIRGAGPLLLLAAAGCCWLLVLVGSAASAVGVVGAVSYQRMSFQSPEYSYALTSHGNAVTKQSNRRLGAQHPFFSRGNKGGSPSWLANNGGGRRQHHHLQPAFSDSSRRFVRPDRPRRLLPLLSPDEFNSGPGNSGARAKIPTRFPTIEDNNNNKLPMTITTLPDNRPVEARLRNSGQEELQRHPHDPISDLTGNENPNLDKFGRFLRPEPFPSSSTGDGGKPVASGQPWSDRTFDTLFYPDRRRHQESTARGHLAIGPAADAGDRRTSGRHQETPVTPASSSSGRHLVGDVIDEGVDRVFRQLHGAPRDSDRVLYEEFDPRLPSLLHEGLLIYDSRYDPAGYQRTSPSSSQRKNRIIFPKPNPTDPRGVGLQDPKQVSKNKKHLNFLLHKNAKTVDAPSPAAAGEQLKTNVLKIKFSVPNKKSEAQSIQRATPRPSTTLTQQKNPSATSGPKQVLKELKQFVDSANAQKTRATENKVPTVEIPRSAPQAAPALPKPAVQVPKPKIVPVGLPKAVASIPSADLTVTSQPVKLPEIDKSAVEQPKPSPLPAALPNAEKSLVEQRLKEKTMNLLQHVPPQIMKQVMKAMATVEKENASLSLPEILKQESDLNVLRDLLQAIVDTNKEFDHGQPSLVGDATQEPQVTSEPVQIIDSAQPTGSLTVQPAEEPQAQPAEPTEVSKKSESTSIPEVPDVPPEENEIPTLDDLRDVAKILGFLPERIATLNRGQLLELISKDPAPAKKIDSKPSQAQAEILATPTPEKQEIAQTEATVNEVQQQPQPQPEEAPKTSQSEPDIETILKAVDSSSSTDVEALVSAILQFLTEGNTLPPNLVLEVPAVAGEPVEISLSSPGASDGQANKDLHGEVTTTTTEEPAKLFQETDPIPSSLLLSSPPSVQQGTATQSTTGQRNQPQQLDLAKLDPFRQQAELLRLAQEHQLHQLNQQEALLRQAQALHGQVNLHQAQNQFQVGGHQPASSQPNNKRTQQGTAGVSSSQLAIGQPQSHQQSGSGNQPFDQVINDVFHFLQQELKTQQKAEQQTSSQQQAQALLSGGASANGLIQALSTPQKEPRAIFTSNAEPAANALNPDAELLKLLQGHLNAATVQTPQTTAIISAVTTPSPLHNSPAAQAALLESLFKQVAGPSPAPVISLPQQQETTALQLPQAPTKGTKIPIDEFTRVSIFADPNGKLHLQIDRDVGPPPPRIEPMGNAAEPVKTEELVIQFGGAKVRVDLDGVQAFAPNSTNITANSTSKILAGSNQHFRNPDEPLLVISPAEFTRNLLVFYDLRDKVKKMAQGQVAAQPALSPSQFGALTSAHLISPTPEQLLALQLQEQQQQQLQLTSAQAKQLATNAQNALSVAPLNMNELRALALVLGHPVTSVNTGARADLERMVSKDILLLSSQVPRQPTL